MIPNQPFQFSINSCVNGYTNHDFTTDARGSVGMVAGEWYNFEIGQERVIRDFYYISNVTLHKNYKKYAISDGIAQ